MGILDEAIREHLELKRRQGAEDSEIQGLESEAFGPAERPDAVEPEIREEGTASDLPGEGDRSDPVSEVNGQSETEPAAGDSMPAEADTEGPAAVAEPVVAEDEPVADPSPVSEPGGASATGTVAAPEGQDSPEAEVTPATEAAAPEPAADTGSTAEPVAESEPERFEEEGDASDMLEAERLHVAEYPTEHYDVDAAMAEEDEIDVLSERSLSDELDRALDGPLESPVTEEPPVSSGSGETSTVDPPFPQPEPPEPDSQPGPPEPVPDPLPPEPGPEAGTSPEPIPEPVTEEPTPEPDLEEEDPGEEDDTASFFDQEDPLEATPEFLEETPEHDRLWFEQKEPKDFDFGD